MFVALRRSSDQSLLSAPRSELLAMRDSVGVPVSFS
jgi:hypothetical protein